MDNRPIGIFDSGLGGLTAARALRELLPNEDIIYFGDTARMPYGTKSVRALRQMARQDMELLDSMGVKAIIAACGTISSTADDVLSGFHLPVFNVVDSSVRAMAAIEGDAPLGIIATEASIRSRVYKNRIAQKCPGREVIALPCQSFVELIESGHSDASDPLVQQVVRDALAPVKDSGVCALLLGCTHFGYLSQAISDYLGEDLRLISASRCAAESMKNYISAHKMTGGSGKTRYYTSGSQQDFTRHASRLMGYSLAGQVESVEAMEVDENI